MDKLSSIASSVAKSPAAVRRALANSPAAVRKVFTRSSYKLGGSKEYSSLANCHENGWLHSDDDVKTGTTYKVKYLGAVEVTMENQGDENFARTQARQAARRLEKEPHPDSNKKMHLNISIDTITLSKIDSDEIVLQHSISRVAFSTVDPENRRLFQYVARLKNSKTHLCHVFVCKSMQDSYELTFTCAQAFDMKFKLWQQQNKATTAQPAGALAAASANASASASGRESPKPTQIIPVRPASPSNPQQHAPAPSTPSRLGVPSSEARAVTSSPQPESKGSNPFYDGYIEAEDEAETSELFAMRALADSQPNLLAIGVDPADYPGTLSASSDWKSEEDLTKAADE